MSYPRDNTVISIDMDGMAKLLYAFMFDNPERLNSQTKFLFDTEEGSYRQIFGDLVLPNTAKKFAAIAALNYFLSVTLRGMEKDHPSDTAKGMAVRSRRHILWAFGFLVRNFYTAKEFAVYNKILDGDAFGDGKFVSTCFKKIFRIIERGFERDGPRESGKYVQNNNVLNFKMWGRDHGKVRALMRELHYIAEDGELPKI